MTNRLSLRIVPRKHPAKDHTPADHRQDPLRTWERTRFWLGTRLPSSSSAAQRTSPLSLPQHPDEHRPERPDLLTVDQELGEGPRRGVPPELADPVGPLEVGERQNAVELGSVD
jgi:hypothetical protein